MDNNLNLAELFQHDLLQGEKVVWASQPGRHRLLTGADFFLVPFSVLWGGFALVWEAGVLGLFGREGDGAPIFFVLWGIPFVVVGQYLIWGRFVYKAWKKRRTVYAVTNKRVLALTTTGSRRLQSAFIQQLPTINKVIRKDRSGDLEFGSSPSWAGVYANSGMDFLAGRFDRGYPAFYDLVDAQGVYDVIMTIKSADQRAG